MRCDHQTIPTNHPKFAGVTVEQLMEKGWMRLSVPTPYLPYANGEFVDTCYSARDAGSVIDPSSMIDPFGLSGACALPLFPADTTTTTPESTVRLISWHSGDCPAA